MAIGLLPSLLGCAPGVGQHHETPSIPPNEVEDEVTYAVSRNAVATHYSFGHLMPETCDDIAGIRFRRLSDCIIVVNSVQQQNSVGQKYSELPALIGFPGWSDLIMAPQKHDQ